MRMKNALVVAGALVLVGCGPSHNVGNTNANGNGNSNVDPGCGNGVLDLGETCDDGTANSDVLPDACRMDCSAPSCGDGVKDSFEQCDDTDLGGTSCEDEGFSGGALLCGLDCALITTGCTGCGNDLAEGSDPLAPGYEVCDGTDLRGADCQSEGFAWGTLSCLPSCGLDTSGCHTDPAVCGNSVIEDQEACDLTALGGATCANIGLGFNAGVLACGWNCQLDTSGCSVCGDGVINGGEACDDGNTIGDLTCSADCSMPCQPGYAECNGDTSTYCAWDGSGVLSEYCDPLMGSSCNATTGWCDGPCSLNQLGSSYIGCDYFPTVTQNGILGGAPGVLLDFAVAVSNSGVATANVTVTSGAATIATTTVAPGDIAVITLPWNSLRTATTTTLVTDGAYRLRTDQPVTVYQYNPLDYTNGSGFTYTNDAALLLPVNTWSGTFRVVSREHWVYSSWSYPGFYAVTASEDNTTVVLTPSATGTSVSASAGVAANGTGTITLHSGDVLQVLTTSGDLTGTLISADKPVQVIGGHECTNVPWNVTACDHLEEVIPPLQTVGYSYLVTAPLINASTPKARMVRVVATAPNTTITYDPAQGGAPTSLANAGDHFEINQTAASFMITASEKILVAEYMLGQDAGGDIGDPAMTLAVAVLQYRSSYLFHAPTNYSANYVNITAVTGATVTLDGAAVGGFTAIGATGYSVARVQLSNSGNGNHTITSTDPFGITVYGYGQYTSYWYPGGLNLSDIY